MALIETMQISEVEYTRAVNTGAKASGCNRRETRYRRLSKWIQPVDATAWLNLNRSAGVAYLRVFLGRSFTAGQPREGNAIDVLLLRYAATL